MRFLGRSDLFSLLLKSNQEPQGTKILVAIEIPSPYKRGHTRESTHISQVWVLGCLAHLAIFQLLQR